MNEDKRLKFVLQYYAEGKMDTRAAIKRFKTRTGVSDKAFPVFRWVGIAASVLLVLGMLAFYFQQGEKMTLLYADATAQRFVLPDGTKLVLAPQASVEYNIGDFENGKRVVRMKGKVYYEVKPDSAHPFEVEASIGRVKVLGTQFLMKEWRDKLTVFVEKGKVAFLSKKSNQGVILTKGMGAELDSESFAPALLQPGKDNLTSWATGKYLFSKTPIDRVLKDLSEYYGVHLAADNSNKVFSGELDLAGSTVDVMIEMIEQVLDIKINKTDR